jgi:hypothetical protein
LGEQFGVAVDDGGFGGDGDAGTVRQFLDGLFDQLVEP